MTNRYTIFSLIVSIAFGYKPSSGETPYSASVNASVQKIECGTESSPFNPRSPQAFQTPEGSRTDRDVEIPVNYHVIYVAGDSIFMNVTVDNQPYEHCSWDIRDYDNNTFLLYPGFGFDYPGHSYSLGGVLPPGNYALFLYDDFGYGGVSATVTTSNGTVLASITQGQWGTSTFLDFTAPEGDYVDGLVSDEIIYEQTDVLNDHYNDLGYSFTVGSIDSAVNAGWYYATDSHKFETGQWSNDDQYLAMAQAMTIDVPTSVNFFWTGATLTSGLGVYPWSFDEDDSRHGLFCSNYTFPGSDGTFSEGITGVHEVGHYFGLHHTFENGCSNPGDEVDDTPYQSQPNYGCPSNNYSCGSYDDIGNFMDYMDDDCLDHFTDGQVDRIEWALETYRPTLLDGDDYEGPVWHIATTGSDSTGDGSAENPFATIQHGIDMSDHGDTVLVAPGSYVENINYNGKNIAVGSLTLTTGETSYITQTVIDGNEEGSVVTFENGEDSTAVLDGFTIRNGDGNLYDRGGGLFINNVYGSSEPVTTPIFYNLNIIENTAYGGGGAYIGGGASPRFFHCNFSYNQAYQAGAIFNDNSSMILENCFIGNNSADDGSNEIYWGYWGNNWGGNNSNQILNSTIVGTDNLLNSGWPVDEGGYEGITEIVNSIIWAEQLPVINIMTTAHQINFLYSNIQGGWDGVGNIEADPLFCAPDSSDYTLAENSPCVGAGQDSVNMGAFDVGCEPILAIDDEIIPIDFALHPPFPNPFNPTTTIRFDLVETRHAVFLHVFDITGRVVGVLVNGRMVTGEYEVQWNASQQSSGIYFAELVAGKKRDVQKLILLK